MPRLFHSEPRSEIRPGVQNRSEVEPLMDVADHRSHLPDPLFELPSRSVSMPRNAPIAPDAADRRELVGLAQVPELDPVLEVSEKSVGVVEPRRSSSPTSEIAQGTEGFEVPRFLSSGARRPWTSWRSWTENSTSLIPPRVA